MPVYDLPSERLKVRTERPRRVEPVTARALEPEPATGGRLR